MSPEDRNAYLAEVREREQKATPGPWRLETDWCDCGADWPCSHGAFPHSLRLPVAHTERDEDHQFRDYDYLYSEVAEFSMDTAKFIACAREDIPKLLAIIAGLLASEQSDEVAEVLS